MCCSPTERRVSLFEARKTSDRTDPADPNVQPLSERAADSCPMSHSDHCWIFLSDRLLGGKDTLVHARRPRGVDHVRPNLTVPHRGDGRAPVVPSLALPDVERGHFMDRGVFRFPHHGLKAPRTDVARNTLAQG